MNHSVKVGSVRIPIYSTPTKRGGKTFPGWTVAFRFAGRRYRKQFADIARAREYATMEAGRLSNGDASGIGIDQDALAQYRCAVEILAPTGKSLAVAASEYAEAFALLKGGSVVEAARAAALRNSFGATTVADLVRQFLEAKKATVSETYHRMMSIRLGRMARAFEKPFSAVTSSDIESWLESLGVGTRAKRNHLSDIAAIVRFAKRRKLLSPDWTELDAIELPAATPGKIQPYTPEELDTLLRYCEDHAPKWLPYVPVRAMTGVRFEEAGRLRPQHFQPGFLALDPDITKTARRRLVPVCRALAAWLRRYPPEEGGLLPCAPGTAGPRFSELLAAAGVTARKNGLRDGYISYRMAIIGDAARVAQEAGNSVAMLSQSYREIRTPDGRVINKRLANRWFGIRPK